MKYLKLLVLLAVGVAALLAFAGTASAQLTSPAGTAFTGTVKATSTNMHTTGTVKMACKHSSLEFAINAGSTGGPAAWTFTECNPDTVTVLKNGLITIDRIKANEGTVTSSELEVTKLTHKTVFGIPVTTHCIYKTNNTDIGTFTGSPSATSNATIHINGNIPRVPTDGACGEDPTIWTGTYTVTSPVPLYLS